MGVPTNGHWNGHHARLAYLPDPETPADMTKVVLNHSHFIVSSAKDQSAILQNKFDSFDKINDRAARLYLLP